MRKLALGLSLAAALAGTSATQASNIVETAQEAGMFNTLIAAIFLTSITNGMILLNIGIYTQNIVSGVILVVALSLDRLRTLRL